MAGDSSKGKSYDRRLALAQRAVACPGWKPMGGMLVDVPLAGRARLYDLGHGTLRLDGPGKATLTNRRNAGRVASMLPVLTDHGTLGCLRELVQQAWPLPGAYLQVTRVSYTEWLVSLVGQTLGKGTTEGEALVHALEVAGLMRDWPVKSWAVGRPMLEQAVEHWAAHRSILEQAVEQVHRKTS